MQLDRIDEELLLAVREDDADEEEDEHAECAISKGCPRELSGSVSTVFEGLDDSCHRVEQHDLMQRRIRHVTQRINDRRRIHPEGNEHAEEIYQVTILGRQRRDDQAQAQGQALNHQHQDRE